MWLSSGCGCFKRKADCRCLKSAKLANTSTPLSSSADSLLEKFVFGNFEGRNTIGNQISLQHVFNRLRVIFQDSLLPTTLIDGHSLSDLGPGSMVDAPRDGKCLLFSLFVAFGSHSTHHAFLRSAICNHLSSIGLQSQFLEAQVPTGPGMRAISCPNANSYFDMFRMGTEDVFGTCVESFIIAQLARVDVVVYHCMISSWFVYEYQGDRNSLIIPRFLFVAVQEIILI